MNNFIYDNKTKVYFGTGKAAEYLETAIRNVGDNVLFAYGKGSVKNNGIYDEIIGILKKCGKNITEFGGIMPNPTYEKVQEGARLARENNIDFILAVGGGSVIDCCKIVSAQAKSDKDIWEMEFGEKIFPSEFIPMGAVVTASGTGAEMNAGAVITHTEKKIKAGVFGAQADFAILDADYTMSLPMKQVISGAFDTLSHCMETYFDKIENNNLSDDINEAIMRSVIRNTRRVYANSDDKEARSELMWASSMAENGILKIGKLTGFQAHQIEHQLGAYTDCNHGQGLAVIHPVMYRHIYKNSILRFARFAKNVWGLSGDDEDALARGGIDALERFIGEIGLPQTLREIGIESKDDFENIANSTNITPGCAKQMTHDEILEILNECY